MADLALAARVILAAVFAVAGVAKLIDRDGARQAIAALAVPRALVAAVAEALPLVELGVAAALLIAATAVGGAIAAMVLLGSFLAGITLSLARGRQPDCRCFGQLHSAPISGATLGRNLALATAAVFVAAEGPGSSLGAWSSGMGGWDWLVLVVALVLVLAFVVEGSLLVTKWRQRRGT